MSYFGGSQNLRGDPGFFGSLFGGIKKIGGAVFEQTPAGRVVKAIRGIRGGQPAPRISIPGRDRFRFGPGSGFVPPGLVAGGIPKIGAKMLMPDGSIRARRRRMNAGNAKALRRAIRRTDAFVKLSRSALKNTGFKIVSKSSGKMTEAAWQKKAHHSK